MKIGIIHLTDLHINENKNWIEDKISTIVSASIADLKTASNAYIIITGDIANKGKALEYSIAEIFFNKLKATLERFCPETTFKFIMVPGNHDCNFDYDTQSRRNDIMGMDYSKIGEDDSVTNSSMSVQKDYWKFYEKFNSLPSNRLFYQIEDSIDESTILFNCFNTAWMSEISEQPGKLFFPVKSLVNQPIKKANGINIALFHHSLSWFTPSTEKSNRKEFKRYLEENSSILIYGHEHDGEHYKNQDLETKQETIYISGNALYDNSNNSSGFQTITIDLETKEGNIKNYHWDKTLYIFGIQKPFKINGCVHWHKDFNHKIEYHKKLNSLVLPLKFENKEKINLSDIYIFPDLEKISKEEKKIDEPYYDSEKLLTEPNLKTIIIEGESQSGKSSLIYMLYLKLVDLNKYPLFIEARDLKKFDFDKAILKAFENQYTSNNLIFETFMQYNAGEKILLVDNLQDLTFNSKTIVNVIKELQARFSQIIIGTSSINAYLSAIESEFEDIDCYSIKSLGFKKRNELIEKYHKLNESPLTVTEQIILEKTKHSFDQVQLVLGNKLMPSYPIYVLSILQSLNYATPYNLEQTSFGYCYQSLIYIALANKANVKNEDIDSYFNFLSEFAFNLYERETTVFSDTDLTSFYKLYSTKFIAKPLAEIKENLLQSKIFIIEEDEYFKFGYTYIFYFLIARKIAEIISTKEGKDIVNKLCKNLHSEKNANILILTAHHSKDDYLIDEATFATMVPFDNLEPITLKRDDNFYKLIEGIVKQVSSDIIQSDKNPREERSKMLDNQDKNQQEIEKTKSDIEEEQDESDESLWPMFQALRAIEIVGQIVKNRKGSIEKDRLISIVTELYNTSFRTISFLGGIFNNTKEDLVLSLSNRIEEGDTKQEIEKKINGFFQYISLQVCLNMFSKLVYSVGNKDLKTLFEQVSTNIDTPAAKLVTFSIKTYYDKMSGRELQALAKEFADNPVALSILKARVRSYIYNNNIDYKNKQKIASALKMKIISK